MGFTIYLCKNRFNPIFILSYYNVRNFLFTLFYYTFYDMGATSGLYRNSKYVRNIRRIILRNRLNSRCLFLWNKGLELLDASIGSLFFFFQPIVGSLLGWLLLNETLNSNFFIGGILIICSVFITTFEKK
ncbi:EamA family transporter [Bacillus cereus group sp. MYBK227-1]|uniref:EamA family transporter n=1 Tax=Bacillus cereus group sp. MYBK227-1 TaxID=3450654 RepID=UPI003F7A3534